MNQSSDDFVEARCDTREISRLTREQLVNLLAREQERLGELAKLQSRVQSYEQRAAASRERRTTLKRQFELWRKQLEDTEQSLAAAKREREALQQTVIALAEENASLARVVKELRPSNTEVTGHEVNHATSQAITLSCDAATPNETKPSAKADFDWFESRFFADDENGVDDGADDEVVVIGEGDLLEVVN